MPELPEVETMVREVRPALVGRTIREATLSHTNVLRGVTSRRFLATLRGARVDQVTRRAKHAVIHLGAHRLVVQPGMTGSLQTQDAPLTTAQRRYAVLRARLDDGRLLIYRDIRRIGTLRLLDERGWKAYEARLGPEPLDPSFTPAVLGLAMRRTRQAAKKALMDQRLVVGVGNIYANEALFAAGIDPSRRADRLDAAAIERLHAAVVRILTAAIDSEGSTIRDYQTGTGQPGNFQLALKVYEREGEPCLQCGTVLAGTHAIDARITVFCYRCQGLGAERAGGAKRAEGAGKNRDR